MIRLTGFYLFNDHSFLSIFCCMLVVIVCFSYDCICSWIHEFSNFIYVAEEFIVHSLYNCSCLCIPLQTWHNHVIGWGINVWGWMTCCRVDILAFSVLSFLSIKFHYCLMVLYFQQLHSTSKMWMYLVALSMKSQECISCPGQLLLHNTYILARFS